MTRPLPQTFAALAALLVVSLTWLPTVATPAAGVHLSQTVRVVSLA